MQVDDCGMVLTQEKTFFSRARCCPVRQSVGVFLMQTHSDARPAPDHVLLPMAEGSAQALGRVYGVWQHQA
jgi:hypothetical protein